MYFFFYLLIYHIHINSFLSLSHSCFLYKKIMDQKFGCPICRSSLKSEASSQCVVTPCGHVYHDGW